MRKQSKMNKAVRLLCALTAVILVVSGLCGCTRKNGRNNDTTETPTVTPSSTGCEVHILSLGKADAIDFSIMPAAIFTEPEAACVGPTEDQLKEKGVAYTCKKSFWRANGKALAMNESEGLLKLMASPQGEILGCHAYGAHSADLIQEVSALMCRDTTVEQLANIVHIHPTLSEILQSAAEQ